jgi:conjugal transfer/type IV secretion protein DotA/TraY
MWVVMQGVGGADTLWNNINSFQANSNSIVTTATPPSLSTVESSMENILQIVGCMQAINTAAFPARIVQINDQYGTPPGSIGSYTPGPSGPANEIDVGGDGSSISQSYCGTITWAPVEGTPQQQATINNAYHQAVINMILSAQASSNTLIANQIAGGVVNNNGSYVNGSVGLSSMIAIVSPAQAYVSALSNLSITQSPSPCVANPGSSACTSSTAGWVLAGAYWLNLANASGNAGNSTNVAAPTAIYNAVNYSAGGFGQSTAKAYGDYINSFANGTSGNLSNSGGGTQGINLNCSTTSMMGPLAGVGFALAGVGGAMAGLVFSAIFCASVNSIFSSFTSISNYASPNSFMNLSQNPISQLQNLGQNILTAVEMIWLVGSLLVLALGIIMSIMSCITGVGYGLISFFVWLIPLLMSLLLALFVSGAMMAYYIPLLPFIYFSFGVLGWLMSVIEAIVAGPLVALGILHPEGHEVWGEAKPAILLLANVLLRPS